MSKKKRADILLIEQDLVKNKAEAMSYIMAGDVFTTSEFKILTPGELLPADSSLYIKSKGKKYVSRGGLKLEKALTYFKIDLNNKVVLDIGASTGGFTDVSLQNGAALVYALDVGTNQLAWKLRSHEQVVVMEQTNFRYSTLADFKKERPNFATIDVSFISLDLILPPLSEIIADQGEVVALIKPQFEAAREDVGAGGIIEDPAVYEEVLQNIFDLTEETNFQILGLTTSPITGSKGNVEFLAHLKQTKELQEFNREEYIEKALKEAEKL